MTENSQDADVPELDKPGPVTASLPIGTQDAPPEFGEFIPEPSFAVAVAAALSVAVFLKRRGAKDGRSSG